MQLYNVKALENVCFWSCLLKVNVLDMLEHLVCRLEPYAIMPPVEVFMELPYEERRAMIYRDLEKGDMVVGRINNIREYGFFLTLLCTAGGLKRDIEDLELSVSQLRLNQLFSYCQCDLVCLSL